MAAPKRRITFLMPFIDFAFMLLIVFVALLSIAYFKPEEISSNNVEQQLQQNQAIISELARENNIMRERLRALGQEEPLEQNQNQNQQNQQNQQIQQTQQLTPGERERLLQEIRSLRAQVAELQAQKEELQKELKGKFGSSEYIDIRK